MSDPIELTVDPSDAGDRLDRFLTERTGETRSTLKRWIEDGRVTIDGEPATAPKTKVRAGMAIMVHPAPPPPSTAIPQDLPLDVRFEDEHLLVVHKPAGLVVHPAPGHPDGTLVNALLHHIDFRDPSGDPMRPGIVHRLDKDTSGTMVVAKTTAAREGLVKLFQEHDLERRYAAIALGRVEERTFDTFHGRHPVHRKRFSSKVERGKRAVTHVEPLMGVHGATLVICTLETGRTHQIRVHLADAGHPILADALYGKPPKDPVLRQAHDAIGRQALHAGLLGFTHPITGETVHVEADIPADFEAALDILRKASG
ncbi:MAG: RluA family pseudouridine synthase [Deltaproteobacteria bacterium]|nr:RluA family pseudouridine synthase [Deltaproteobacteria bacterium]